LVYIDCSTVHWAGRREIAEKAIADVKAGFTVGDLHSSGEVYVENAARGGEDREEVKHNSEVK
jgi:hypothetical protein